METTNIIDRWNQYIENINKEFNNMYNFLLYKNFVNEEINRLNKENMIKDVMITKLANENKQYKRKLETNDSSKSKKSKTKNVTDFYMDEFYKNTADNTQFTMDEQDKIKELENIFNNLNSIKDIVNLKNNIYRFQFIENIKFKKIYNLIPVLEELDSIVGMNNVKRSIFESICYFIHGLNNNNELNHVMITGPPGVGKTTIAKIIGKIYLALGFLENDTFNIAKRSDLIGKFLGQTSILTQQIIDNSIGGVLFIDEVYSLGNPDGKDSYAKECIDTINLNMTRDEKWLLIVGGYKEDIEQSFLSFNKGLERRFTVKLNIEGYDGDELFYIFKKFIDDNNWKLQDDDYVKKLINKNLKHFKFYGGDMLKIFQKAKEFYSLRLMKTILDIDNCSSDKVLTNKDIENSIVHLINTTDKTSVSEYMSMYI